MSLYLPLFKALNEANVQYIVVGGIATILHGYVRATSDIDLVVDLQVEEATKVITVLTEAGYVPKVPVKAMEFADSTKREQWITEKGMQVFSMYQPTNPLLTIDLFVKQPIAYSELYERSVVMNLEGTNIRVCSIDDLIAMKKLAGRPKDLADIEKLTKIKEYEKE